MSVGNTVCMDHVGSHHDVTKQPRVAITTRSRRAWDDMLTQMEAPPSGRHDQVVFQRAARRLIGEVPMEWLTETDARQRTPLDLAVAYEHYGIVAAIANRGVDMTGLESVVHAARITTAVNHAMPKDAFVSLVDDTNGHVAMDAKQWTHLLQRASSAPYLRILADRGIMPDHELMTATALPVCRLAITERDTVAPPTYERFTDLVHLLSQHAPPYTTAERTGLSDACANIIPRSPAAWFQTPVEVGPTVDIPIGWALRSRQARVIAMMADHTTVPHDKARSVASARIICAIADNVPASDVAAIVQRTLRDLGDGPIMDAGDWAPLLRDPAAAPYALALGSQGQRPPIGDIFAGTTAPACAAALISTYDQCPMAVVDKLRTATPTTKIASAPPVVAAIMERMDSIPSVIHMLFASLPSGMTQSMRLMQQRMGSSEMADMVRKASNESQIQALPKLVADVAPAVVPKASLISWAWLRELGSDQVSPCPAVPPELYGFAMRSYMEHPDVPWAQELMQRMSVDVDATGAAPAPIPA